MNPFLRKKSIEQLQQESVQNTGLQRVLGLWQLTAIGLGGITGVGIFVLTGVAAAEQAGPAVLLSFIIAGYVQTYKKIDSKVQHTCFGINLHKI